MKAHGRTPRGRNIRRVALAVLIGGAGAIIPVEAFAASVTPTTDLNMRGYTGCADEGLTGATQLNYGNTSGTATDGTLTVNVTVPSTVSGAGTGTFDFTASFPSSDPDLRVLAVLVKGGSNGGNVYDYRPGGTLGDTNLTTPVTGGSGSAAGISGIVFCYGTGQSTTTTTTGTTTTTTVTTTTTNTPTTTNTTTTTTGTLPTSVTSGTSGTAVQGVKKNKKKKHKKHRVKAKKITRPAKHLPTFTG